MIEHGTAAFRKTTWVMFLAGFTTFATLYGVQPLLPLFSQSFHVSPTVAGLSMSLTTMSMAVGMLGVSVFSDLWSRKQLMAASLLLSSAISVLLALSPSFSVLLLLRMLQGFSLAALPAIAMIYLSEEIGPASLGLAMGLYISGNSLGGMLGRMLAGLTTDWLGWQAAMLFLGMLGLAAGILFSVLLPPSRHCQKRSPQGKPLLTSAGEVLRHRGLLWLFGIGFVLMGCFVCLFNYIGYQLTEPPYSLDSSWLGWIFAVYLAGTFSSTWMGKLADKHGMGCVLVSGIVLMVFGTLLTLHASLWIKVVGMAWFAFGFFGSHSVASSWVGRMAGEWKAQAASFYLFFYYIGSSVVGALGGTLWSKLQWMGVVCLIVTLLLSLLLVSIVMVHRLKRGESGTRRLDR